MRETREERRRGVTTAPHTHIDKEKLLVGLEA
jgi:hypothetical protein